MKSLHEPVYRPIIVEAFRIAWAEKRYWPIAVFAGILLSGSIYDVIWKGVNAISPQATLFGTVAYVTGKAASTWAALSPANLVIGAAQVLLISLFFILIGFAVFAASVIAQSALIFGIGARGRTENTVRNALAVGGRALWPILVLNLIALAVLFATRALIAIAMSFLLAYGSTATVLAYLLSFILFTLVGIATVIVQIFALNAMILQGATLPQAIERGLSLLKRDWVTTVETAAILFAISLGAYILTIASAMVITVPFIILFMLAAVIASPLATAFLYLYFLVMAAFILSIFGFIVIVHYAAWTLLYRRLGEGGVIPKLHRIVRSWVHSYGVKGA